MQHIVNIAFDFDDDKIRSIAEKKCQDSMDEIIKDIILDQIAPMRYSFYEKKETRDWSMLHGKLDKAMRDFVESHGDEIIELAAEKLADSFKRTKIWKEKAKEAME